MITISFDEYGSFEEGAIRSNDLSIIAGFLYDDMGIDGERANELERIKAYLTKICKDAGKDFPGALHYNSDNSSTRSGSVEKIFEKSLSEFLNKGTYNRKPIIKSERQGKYYVFSYMRTAEGKKNSMPANTLNESGDYSLSSLYTYMVTDVFNHIIFNNPVISCIDRVYFDLPTRSFLNDLSETEKKKFNSRYRMGKAQKENEKDIVYVTGLEMFRTAIERELYYSSNSIEIEEIKARPIYYKKTDKFSDTDIYEAGFVYLSDLLCAVIHKGADGRYYKLKDLMKIPTRIDNLCGMKSLDFFYDTTDIYYAKALESVQRKDYMSALDYIYKGINQKSECAEYYKKKWFKLLIDLMNANADIDSFVASVKQLKRYSLSNNIEQDKFIFMVKKLDEIRNHLSFDKDEQKAVLYDFFQVVATAYNHQANSREAKKYIKLAEENIGYVTLEQRLDFINKEAVTLCDELDYSTAVLKAHKAQKAWDSISDIRKFSFNEMSEGLGARKAYSQLGQVYAFAGDSRAEFMFVKSVADVNDPNALITMSYLLHYYADQGMKTKYDNLAQVYFGGKINPSDQLRYLVDEGTKNVNPIFSMKFAMYVYVRGIYLFHMQDIADDSELMESLMDIEGMLRNTNERAMKELNGHPWEIIFKYLSLIALELHNDTKAQEYLKLSERILVKNGRELAPLLCAIIAYGKLEYMEKKDPKATNKLKGAVEACWKEVCDITPRLEREYKNPEKRNRNNLRLLLTYMYH